MTHTEIDDRDLVINLSHIESIEGNQTVLNKISGKLKKNKIVIINCSDDVLNLQRVGCRMFGPRVNHEKQNESGILVIDSLNPNSVNVANTRQPHLPHTDDSYMPVPGKILTMQCRYPASVGGETILVSGKAVYDFIVREMPDAVNELFREDCISIGRKLPGEDKEFSVKVPIFTQKGNKIEIRWRSYDTYIKDILPKAREAYMLMNEFINEPSNQMVVSLKENQILVLDNTSILHGRRPYEPTEKRQLWRVNYHCDEKQMTKYGLGIESSTLATGKGTIMPNLNGYNIN